MISKTNGKGPWSFEEDNKLLEWVKANGPQKWSLCSETIPGRSGKQCRERWFNNLNPNVKKGNWTAEEDDMIFQGYLQHGSSWSRIAKNLEGRTENSVKNRFYSTVRKLLSDSEKNSGKSSEQQIRNIIEMSLGKKVGGGLPINNNDENSDDNSSDDDEDKSHNEVGGSSKNLKSSEAALTHEGESSEIAKKEEDQPKANGSGNVDIKKIGKAAQETVKEETSAQEQGVELKKSDSDIKQEGEGVKKNNNGVSEEDHHHHDAGMDEESSSHQGSSSQQMGSNGANGLMKRKYNRKRHQDEYSESNLLYRLLKSNDVTIKNTKCLQDYSVFYRKYKQNKYMMKKKKKEDEAKQGYPNGEDGDDAEQSSLSDQQMEEEEAEDSNLQEQQLAATIAANSKNNKGKAQSKNDVNKRGLKGIGKNEQNMAGLEESQNDLDEQEKLNHQMLLLQQVQQQLSGKLKKKLKVNPSSKSEGPSQDQGKNKSKNAKNQSKGKNAPSSNDENDEDDEENSHQQMSGIDQENEDHSGDQSALHNDDFRMMAQMNSENMLDDGNEQLESQLLKYFQKSMGQFFKKFIKQNKITIKDQDKKSKQKEIKKQQAQQQQLLQLQIQEQIQKQLEQLNNQNVVTNTQTFKNNVEVPQVQRTNTIIQNPPNAKNAKTQPVSKKNGNNLPPNINGLEKQVQKQLLELSQNQIELQQANKEAGKISSTNSFNLASSAAGAAPLSNNGGKLNSTIPPYKPQQPQNKQSFQHNNKNQNTPRNNGYTNQIGSSSSLFSQPNTNNYNINQSGFGGLLSSHSLQMQQQQTQNSNALPINSTSNMNIQNLKNLLNQSMYNSNNLSGSTSQPQVNNLDQGVDQKMIFLLNQLNTLESMLSNTKKELVKLEASLSNQRGSDNFSQAPQPNTNSVRINGGGYGGNPLQGSSHNLFGSNSYYNLHGGLPPTANILNTLPSFGSRNGLEKSENGNLPYNKRKNSKDNTSQFSDFDKFINNNN